MSANSIAEEAAQWLEALRSGRATSQAFLAWLRTSPRHIEEVLLISTVEGTLLQFGNQHRDTVTQLLCQIKEESGQGNVLPLDLSVPAPRIHSKRWMWAAGLAATIVLGASLLLPYTHPNQQYSTRIGEQRTLELEDGSLVYLNTDSKLDVAITQEARDIRLIQGEALFDVERDSLRPFRVHTAEAIIQAIGTQFNVYRRAGNTRVAVIEGSVKVAGDKTLTAGEQVELSGPDHIVNQTRADLPRVTAWRTRRLVFHDETLANIASEFNRYNRRRSVHVDEAVGSRRFTGTFNADAPESLARALATDQSLEVRSTSEQIVIEAKLSLAGDRKLAND